MKLSFYGLPEALVQPVADVLPILRHELVQNGVSVRIFSCEKGFAVSKDASGLSVSYADKADLFRALTFLAEVDRTGETVTQDAAFSLLCYMADVSRNAVLSMDGARRLIRYLALMGYNSMMLYAEDTFEIPEYPYFGHMRGRYSVDELRALDDYADSYGIELIPCVQTLAHLASTLRWPCFKAFSDTEDILLVGDPRTYEFIDKMLSAIASCFRSKRVHIGMDEAHNLGLGKYLDKNGFRNRFDILSEHLAKVKDLCSKYDLAPMIWSDMYFRLYNHGGYYLPQDVRLPSEVTEKVPEGVDLVYWDYYTENIPVLDNMFENHKLFSGRQVFAGGAWKWTGFAPCGRISVRRCLVHAEACFRHGCNDVIVTGWGDNGGEASQFSVLPSLMVYAECCYSSDVTENSSDLRFREIFGLSFEDFYAMDLVDDILGVSNPSPCDPCKYLLYNGVLGGLFDAHVPAGISDYYLKASRELLKRADDPQFGYMFATLASLSYLLEKKSGLSVELRAAYAEGKKDVLLWYAEKEIPEVISRLDDFIILFRQQWYLENKTFGFDVQEIRLGGLRENLRSAAVRIKSFCNGEFDRIEELEQPVLPMRADAEGNPKDVFSYNNWKEITSASRM